MQDSLKARLQGYAVAGIVGLIAVVFILQFGGPQSEGCTQGGSSYAAKVYGETILDTDFRAAYQLTGFSQESIADQRRYQMREHTLNGLIERNLLARAARDLGYEVTEDQVWEHIAEKGTCYLSLSVEAAGTLPSGGEVRIPVQDADGNFDMQSAKRFIQLGLRRSVREFGESQIAEMLADRMRRTLSSNVRISPQEIWDAWVREHETVTLKYVRFSPAYYQETLQPTAADIQTWMEANREEMDREWTRRRHRYTGLEKQARARHILIKADENASDEVKAAARARVAALLARARAGEDFAVLARDNSEDTGSAREGGDLGWSPRGRMVPPFDEAMFNLQPGQLSDIVETQFGYHVIKLEGFREGDVPEAEARREIAEELYRQKRGEEMAREAATRALQQLRDGMSLEDLDAQLRPTPAQPAQPPPDGQEAPPENALAPRVQETRPFGRSDAPIPGAPSEAAALTRAAFELTEENPLPREPMNVGDDFIVFRLENHVTADEADFSQEDRTRLREALTRAKQQEALVVFVRQLRRQAEEDGAIRVNEEMLDYDAPVEGEEEGDEPRRDREEEPAEGEG